MQMKGLTDTRSRNSRTNESATVYHAWHAAHFIYNESLRRNSRTDVISTGNNIVSIYEIKILIFEKMHFLEHKVINYQYKLTAEM